MVANTLTGQQLQVGLSKFVDDYQPGTTTSNGASDGSTIIDTSLEIFGDNRLVGQYVRITGAGTTQYQVSRVTSNTQASGSVSVSPSFTAQVSSTVTYELHKYEPRKKFTALDSARMPVVDNVFRLLYDETVTSDGYSREFDIPPTMQRGPSLLFVERIPWSPNIQWNFIPSAQNEEGMLNWTFSNSTAVVYGRVPQDVQIPKYGPACTRVSVPASQVGTATLPIAKMINTITASGAAGRTCTWAQWVYCKVPSRLTLLLIGDSGTIATSSLHQGRGWELLYITGTPPEDNSTTLSLRISVSSVATPVTYYVNNGWFYYGDFGMAMSNFYEQEPIRVRRDDVTQRFYTTDVIPERRQLRLVGKELLSALGDVVATQVTNTMEVSEATAEVLYAQASEILFQLERISTQNTPQVLERIKMVRDRAPKLDILWGEFMPERRVTSPYMR